MYYKLCKQVRNFRFTNAVKGLNLALGFTHSTVVITYNRLSFPLKLATLDSSMMMYGRGFSKWSTTGTLTLLLMSLT